MAADNSSFALVFLAILITGCLAAAAASDLAPTQTPAASADSGKDETSEKDVAHRKILNVEFGISGRQPEEYWGATMAGEAMPEVIRNEVVVNMDSTLVSPPPTPAAASPWAPRRSLAMDVVAVEVARAKMTGTVASGFKAEEGYETEKQRAGEAAESGGTTVTISPPDFSCEKGGCPPVPDYVSDTNYILILIFVGLAIIIVIGIIVFICLYLFWL